MWDVRDVGCFLGCEMLISVKTDAICCFDSPDKSLPINNISWKTTDKSEQQKTDRKDQKVVGKTELELMLNSQRLNLRILNTLTVI